MLRDTVLTFGPFRLDPRTESLWRAGLEIRLRPKTFAVLRHLAERPGRLVTKDELLAAIWPDVEVGEEALTVCVNEIRRALGDGARAPRFVETLHRRGYRFVGEIGAAGANVPDAMVGRESELRALQACLARAAAGRRQVVFITGEAGIGKTTLVEGWLGAGAGEASIGRGQCLDHHGAGEAYLPVLEAVGRLARGPGGDRIVAALERHAPIWLAQMPGLLGPDDVATLQRRVAGTTRERMLREMTEALEALAAERLLVLVLEDLHWSDPSTLDLLARVARRSEPARLLIVGTYRPVDAALRGEALPALARELAMHGACTTVPLAPLTEAEVHRYLMARLGDTAAAGLAAGVHRRTEGLPLFVVNVADALLRLGPGAAGPADVEAVVPESLRQMIEQQLASLAPDDVRLLEAASVAGTTFSAAAPAAALGETVEIVEDRCETLARREQFIGAGGVEEWPDGTVAACYRFRHVFYQHVLYERLTASRRAGFHLRIGEREEAAYRGRPGERTAVLAVHFERGRDAGRAVRYRRQAAEQALQRCAYAEALDHLGRGAQLLEHVTDPTTRLALDCDLQATLGPTLYAVRGPTASEVEAAYLRGHELAQHLGDPDRLYTALWGRWYLNYGRSRYVAARELGEQLLALAEQRADPAQLLEAHHALWPTVTAVGTPAAVQVHLERGLALYDAGLHHAQVSRYSGHDTGVCCRIHLALAQWRLGSPAKALDTLRNALALEARLGHPMTAILARCFAAWIHFLRGEREESRHHANRLLELAAAQGAVTYEREGVAILAVLELLEDPDRDRVAACHATLVASQGARTAWRSAMSFCALAEIAATIGEVDAGLAALARIPAEQSDLFFAPEFERVRGELLRRSDRAQAEQCLRRAVECARTRGERSLELRAATSLARLLWNAGRHVEARKNLDAVYRSFTEGSDTADLRAARDLLSRAARR
jgi:DNA-binding winged helix-turn-helix (wHTH) protein/tetratricopeptide (TPR) repeat protein